MVVDPSTIYVERGGVIEESTCAFTDDEAARTVIERIVTPLGRRIDESTPVVDARLPDGSRVHAVIAPLASRGTCITIRKFPGARPQLAQLIAWGSLSEPMASLLERSVRLRKNIVISGGTGSGKTTLLNVLSAAIPSSERVITIEDAAELCLQQKHVVSLEARLPNLEGKGAFPIRELVRNALRMRPDRIVVGECRGGEALDMLQAMNTGHEGSMTTLHANSPREACARLETLCLMSGLSLPLSAIRRQIAGSVHLLVQQARLGDGRRRVTSLTEITGLSDDGELELRELHRFEPDAAHPDGGAFAPTGYLPSFASELEATAGEHRERTAGGVP
jgi:pilus assembly protein CpaF